MSRPILEVNTAPSADTWFNLFDKLDQVIDVISNNALTAGPTANGDNTVGNAWLTGTFAANVVGASILRGRECPVEWGLECCFKYIIHGRTD